MSGPVRINSREVVTSKSGGISFAFGDVCTVPEGGGPIPFVNVAVSADAAGTSRTVRVNGVPVMLARSTFGRSTGDEAGKGGGVLSGTCQGAAIFSNYSYDVRIERQNVPRAYDPMLHNLAAAGLPNAASPAELQPAGAVDPDLEAVCLAICLCHAAGMKMECFRQMLATPVMDGPARYWDPHNPPGLYIEPSYSMHPPPPEPMLSKTVKSKTMKDARGNPLPLPGGDRRWTPGSPAVTISGLSDIREISQGWYHACALRNDGNVLCWGENYYGQLGNGSTEDAGAPTMVAGLSNVVQIAAGEWHTCAREAGGTVLCFGANSSGQLGAASSHSFNTLPLKVADLSGAADIATGAGHSCARQEDGALKCWGNNAFGQLGDGRMAYHPSPTSVPGATNVAEVAAGEWHTCTRQDNGTVMCWGWNDWGQLGDGTMTSRPTPGPVLGLADVVQIAAGYSHTCARRINGTVSCWGGNESGQLGDGTTTRRLMPTPVPNLGGVLRIAAGYEHTCALLSGGQVRCWGGNAWGQLGDGTNVDKATPAVAAVSNAITIAPGGWHTCALLATNDVMCWGSNGFGELGHGVVGGIETSPVAVVGLSGVLDVAAGELSSCSVHTDGAVRCWGRVAGNSPLPTWVPGSGKAVAVAVHGVHGCAREADGIVRCWGDNRDGQVGDGTTIDKTIPPKVLEGAASVSLGAYHSCARLAGATAKCWGSNGAGQLGDGIPAAVSSPVEVMW